MSSLDPSPSTGICAGRSSARGHARTARRSLCAECANLDAWMTKLRAESVKILAGPYRLGDVRAVLIEGPSLEALELVEVTR